MILVPSQSDIAKNWLPRVTGMPLEKFGRQFLLTIFKNYVNEFAEQFDCDIYGEHGPMQAATNAIDLTIISFEICSPNASALYGH